MKNSTRFIAFLLLFTLTAGLLPISSLAAGSGSDRPVIGSFSNHKDNEKNRFTFANNNLGQTVISYDKNATNWDIAEAKVTGYSSGYTRLCVTAVFNGTKQFGIEVKVSGMDDQELRDAEIALTKNATLNPDGSYTFDISIPQTISKKGISALYFFLDPEKEGSGNRSMTILDVNFRKAGETATPTTYAISTDPLESYVFSDAVEGYKQLSAKTVNVVNTGNVATESLTVKQSASDWFTLSASSLSSIAVGGTKSFTIVPKNNLDPGTYTSTVTISNGNISEKLIISFKVTEKPFDHGTNRPVIGVFSNHKDNEKNRFTFTENSLGQTIITYDKKASNWDLAEANVTGYSSVYTRLCVTATFNGTQQFGIEVKVPGMSNQELRDAEIALTKNVTRNPDGSYTYDISIPQTISKKGISALYFILDPEKSGSGNRSMTILDISFLKAGESYPVQTEDTYGISLQPSGKINFPAAIEGYVQQNVFTVTVKNEGNVATGELNVTLSGATPPAFIIESSLNSIAVGGTGFFTILPAPDLKVGTHTATATISNANVPPKQIELSFEVIPVKYDITVEVVGSSAFDDVTVGYGQQTPKTIKVTNTGNVPTGELNVVVSDYAFAVSATRLDSIPVGASAHLIVTPVNRLSVGDYLTVILVGNNNIPDKQVTVTLKVNPPPPPIDIEFEPTEYNFPDAEKGYGTQLSLAVKVNNIGNVATGRLDVTCSDSNAFTMSELPINNIPVRGSSGFSVRPNDGLPEGDYNAIITVTPVGGISKTLKVTFTVTAKPPVVLGLDPTVHIFPKAEEGYGEQLALTVTARNIGTVATGDLNVEMAEENQTQFTVSRPTLDSIAVKGFATFTVKPNVGLPAGTYTAPITVWNSYISKTMTVTFTVTPEPTEGDFFVSLYGNNSNDGSSAKPWRTIQHGIDNMTAGSTLIVRAGIYNESIVINKAGLSSTKLTTIKGEDGTVLIGDNLRSNTSGYGNTYGNCMVRIHDVNWVCVENLEIRDYRPSGTVSNAGILVEATKSMEGIEIIGNTIHGINITASENENNGHGIAVYGRGTTESAALKNVLIDGNEVYDCLLGQSEAVVVNANVTDWQIVNNYIHDNDNIGIDAIGGEEESKGAAVDRARNGIISGNVVVDNECIGNKAYHGDDGCVGIYVDGGRDIVIENNYIRGSCFGIELGTEKKSGIYRPENITIQNNIIAGNRLSCILLGGTEGIGNRITVEHNTLWNRDSASCLAVEKITATVTFQQNIILRKSFEFDNESDELKINYGTGNVYFGVTRRPSDRLGVVASGLPIIREPSGNDPGDFTIVPEHLPATHKDAGARLTISSIQHHF